MRGIGLIQLLLFALLVLAITAVPRSLQGTVFRGRDAYDRAAWRPAAARYLGVAAAGHLTWEAAHVRLYTIWANETAGAIWFAVLHCTGGDVVLSAAIGPVAWLACGRPPPLRRYWRPIALGTILLGLPVTIGLELLNTQVWKNWAYSPSMPLVPGTEIGLTPVLQWLLVPALALLLVRPALRRSA